MHALRSSLIITILLMFSWVANADSILQTIDGEHIPLSSLRGKWVFINYWASWCQPCVNEITEFNRFYAANKNNVAVFAVNYDSLPLSKQQRLIKKFNIHYPSLKYKSLVFLNLGNISVVPITFVLNPQGKLSTTLLGGQTRRNLEEAMSEGAF